MQLFTKQAFIEKTLQQGKVLVPEDTRIKPPEKERQVLQCTVFKMLTQSMHKVEER